MVNEPVPHDLSRTRQVPAEHQWHRVHAITPYVRGWLILAAIIVAGGQNVGQSFLEDADEFTSGMSKNDVLIVGAIILGVLLVIIGYGVLAWRKMLYRYDDEAAYMKTGIVFRQERKVRLDRVQSIDIVKPFLARIFGLAELKISSAAGIGSTVRIGFLRDEDANELRSELLARAAGLKRGKASRQAASHQATLGHQAVETQVKGAADSLEDADLTVALTGSEDNTSIQTVHAYADADSELDGVHTDAQEIEPSALEYFDSSERMIYQVPPRRVIGSALLSFPMILLAILAIVSVGSIFLGWGGVSFAMIPAVLGIGSAAWGRISGDYGFVGAIAHDGIRVKSGLLETHSRTVPPGRIQAVRIRQSLFWRKPGWWRVDVNLAGQDLDTNGGSMSMESLLLPVGSHVEAMDALWLALPDLGHQTPLELLADALNGTNNTGEFTTSPRRARWLDPMSYKRNGYAVTDTALIFRSGWLVRKVVVVPHERTQSIGAKQGPWQRKLELATFAVHSTFGDITPEVPHQSLEHVRTLLADQAMRAQQARAIAQPEQWLEQVTANLRSEK